MPPTLQALLAARLDQLDEPERTVLERGAVEGEIFHRGAVQALAPEETQRDDAAGRRSCAGAHPPRPRRSFAGDDALPLPASADPRRGVRRAPQGAPGRAARALRRLAGRARRALVELDEIVGYHLEQAVRYTAELGDRDPTSPPRRRPARRCGPRVRKTDSTAGPRRRSLRAPSRRSVRTG